MATAFPAIAPKREETLGVAVGAAVDVVDVEAWRRVETVATEPGAHTIALDTTVHRIYAFLPGSHRAMVFHEVA